ncbi:MAG: nucleotidyltransferase family protein [Ignavibacteriales bacterium]|nr:nucleotidyltransferase family protein [Ignavibacteriales bacterium]
MNPSSTAIIILAAGNSSRLGLPKQLLQYHGMSLLRHAAETALATHPAEIVAVVGFESDRMRHELDDLPVHIVVNSTWQEGISSSIREGIESLPPASDAGLLMLCDQPFVTTELLIRLITGCTDSRPIAATGYEQTSGVPACFKRSLFPELMDLTGDRGAKRVIDKNPSRVATILFDAANIDIDTLEDYQKYINSTH